MHIVALAWIYVVSMMAITEKTVVAGVMTFVMYCLIPLGILWFLLVRRKRYARRPGTVTPSQESIDIAQQQHDSNKS